MTTDEPLNLDPGPVPLADATRDAMMGPVVSHRSPGFEALYRSCVSDLEAVFRTSDDLVVVNGSGTVGLEAAVASCIGPDETVVCLRNGRFGEKLADLVERHADSARTVDVAWGEPFDLAEVEAALGEDVDAVTLTHCESSTGTRNPVEAVAAMAAEHAALSIVDGVSSIGGERFPVDEWGVDLAVTASQKCLSGPPGLSAVSISERAKERVLAAGSRTPWSLDLRRYLEYASRDQTPNTPPVPIFRGLAASLQSMVESGLDRAIAKRRAHARAIREAATAMGMTVFGSPEAVPSNTVTVLSPPEGVSGPRLRTELARRGVSVGGGMRQLQSSTIRVATMSQAVSDADVVEFVATLEDVLATTTDGRTIDGPAVAARVLEESSPGPGSGSLDR